LKYLSSLLSTSNPFLNFKYIPLWESKSKFQFFTSNITREREAEMGGF